MPFWYGPRAAVALTGLVSVIALLRKGTESVSFAAPVSGRLVRRPGTYGPGATGGGTLFPTLRPGFDSWVGSQAEGAADDRMEPYRRHRIHRRHRGRHRSVADPGPPATVRLAGVGSDRSGDRRPARDAARPGGALDGPGPPADQARRIHREGPARRHQRGPVDDFAGINRVRGRVRAGVHRGWPDQYRADAADRAAGSDHRSLHRGGRPARIGRPGRASGRDLRAGTAEPRLASGSDHDHEGP